ncbi:MAG: dTMP kinase [Bacteroidota bacterium]|nr:dTMP kinase [Bacteroidota bacterium]
MTNRNLFIAFEGIDGSGKSTQVKLLAEKLESIGHKVYTTFEPTDSEIGSIIRNILIGKKNADNRTIAGLFVADRLNHLLNDENGIVKKMKEGFTVLTDRYYFSSYAYNGTHMDINWVIDANAMSASILRPHLNIFIDVPPEVSMSRINGNRDSIDLYENLENLKKVRAKYLEAFALLYQVEKIYTVDGNKDPEIIHKEIVNKIEDLI